MDTTSSKTEWKLIDRILQHSEEKNDWNKAKKEWEITLTYEQKGSTCLCSKYPITKIIKLRNKINANALYVGRCCINKIISTYEGIDAFQVLNATKVNRKLPLIAFKQGKINEKEYDFLMDVPTLKKMSEKQKTWYYKILTKLYQIE